MRARLLHLLLLLAVLPAMLAGAGMDVALQVTLSNPAVDGPTGLSLTEGPTLDAALAADGTAIVVGLPGSAFVGATVTLIITAPGGGTTAIDRVLDAGDLLLGSVAIPVPAALLTAEGAYGTAATLGAPDGSVSPATGGPAFRVDRTPAVALTGVIGHGIAVPAGTPTFDRRPWISGTATPGSALEVFADGIRIGDAVAAGDGTWTMRPAADLPLGWTTLTARATSGGTVSPPTSGYAIEVLEEDRGVDVGDCGASAWTGLFLLVMVFTGLRKGRWALDGPASPP